MICVAAVILAFAEEVSVSGICAAADILVFAEEVSVRVICGDAVILTRVPGKNCQVRVSYQSVKLESPTGVSGKGVLQDCQARVSYESVKQACQVRVS